MPSSLVGTARGPPPCLGVPPALVRTTFHGWDELTGLLIHAEAAERRRIEQTQRSAAEGLKLAARRQSWRGDDESNEEGDSLVDEHNRDESTSRACAGQPRYLTSPSPSAQRTPHNHAAVAASPSASLTPFQRFCFTKSTLLRYVAEEHARTAQQSRSPTERHNGSASKSRAARRASQSAELDHPDRIAPPPPMRDLWSRPHARSRDVAAPESVPTLSRTYGSAAQRAVSMELIFERLSYEGKAQVARHAASLGLLPQPPSSPSSPVTPRNASADSEGQMHDVDATVLTGVLDDTACSGSAGFPSGLEAGKPLSPAPVAPLNGS